MKIIKKYKTISILVFLIIITVVLGAFFKKTSFFENKENLTTTIKLTQTPKPEPFINADQLNLPASYMGFVISKTESDPSIEKNALYYGYNAISLSLSAWLVKRENIGRGEYGKLSDLVRNFLNTEFTKRGWSPEIIVDGKSLKPFTADGPGGGIWGYIKKEGNKFQVVLIQEIEFSKKGQPVSSLTRDCPCNIEFRIFLSNVEDLDSFLKSKL